MLACHGSFNCVLQQEPSLGLFRRPQKVGGVGKTLQGLGFRAYTAIEGLGFRVKV